MDKILYVGLIPISGVLLWLFPSVMPLTFCIYAGYCVVLYVFKYQYKVAIHDPEHSSQRNNYFRLVALIVDVSYVVLWKYIEEQVIGSNNFESYLNTITAKHCIFHLYKIEPCCECRITKIKGEKLISDKQFRMLYQCDKNKSLSDHQKYSRGKLSQNCICCYSAVQNVSVRVLDITLSNHLIKRCGKQALGLEVWMRTITEIRNEIFHHSDIQEMTDDKFSRRWQKLEGSIMGIANLISAEFAREINGKIENLKHLVVIPDQVLQHERLCRDYWKSKCAEFEKMQMEEIKASTKQLCQLYAVNTGGRPIDGMCEEVFKKIETLNTAVDKIFVNVFGSDGVTQMFEPHDTPTTEEDQKTVPVLIQLEVPTSWNTRKIIKAVEQIRLCGNGDSGLQIKAVSNDDLYIFAEIVKKVLRESESLRIEINQLMTNILSLAKVKVDERADVNINLKIPEYKAFHAPTRAKTEIKNRIPFRTENFETNCIIAGNHIVVVEAGNRLQIYEMNGTFHRNINLKFEGVPNVQCLTVIDFTSIAILYNFSHVDVLDLSTGILKNTIKLRTVGSVVDIAYQDGLLYCKRRLNLEFRGESNGTKDNIVVVNLLGELIRYFFVTVIAWDNKSIVTNSNRLFSLVVYDSVNCYDLKGALQWKFQCDEGWHIRFITTYEDGQLFVYDDKKKKIVLFSADGKSFDEVLTLKNTKQLSGMYYDKTLMILMLYDTDGVYLFRV